MKAKTQTLRTLLEEANVISAAVHTTLSEAIPLSFVQRWREMDQDLTFWIEQRILDGKNPIDLYFEVKVYLTKRPSFDTETLMDLFFDILDQHMDND